MLKLNQTSIYDQISLKNVIIKVEKSWELLIILYPLDL